MTLQSIPNCNKIFHSNEIVAEIKLLLKFRNSKTNKLSEALGKPTIFNKTAKNERKEMKQNQWDNRT